MLTTATKLRLRQLLIRIGQIAEDFIDTVRNYYDSRRTATAEPYLNNYIIIYNASHESFAGLENLRKQNIYLCIKDNYKLVSKS